MTDQKESSAAVHDLSLAHIGLNGTYEEYAFFDRVRRLLGNKDTYVNFMRCLNLYVDDRISERDLLHSIQPFTAKFPEIAAQMRVLFGVGTSAAEPISRSVLNSRLESANDVNMDIDYASCRKQGASYRPLPSSYEQPVCSSRDSLCNSVLNDTWVSFPLWSEDTTLQFGESKISAYQEFLYRCEDERFELDIVIENISSTIEILEEVVNQMEKMSPEEARKFQLDDSLGGTSEVLQKKALQRIYGDKSVDMMEGLKRRPAVAVPIVIRRLKAKVAEWRIAQHDFNQTWREQNEKQLAKSLTADAGGFRQTESRAIRSKSLLNEAMAVHEENQALQQTSARRSARPMEFFYDGGASVLADVRSLLLFHVVHCGLIPGEDAPAVRHILVYVLPRLLDTSSFRRRCLNPLLNNARVMYANSTWYIFVRLHHRLCQRIKKVRAEAERLSSVNHFTASDLTTPEGVRASSLYEHTLNMIKCLSEGLVEVSSYEDVLRKTYGRQAAVTFTIDRLLQHIVKQLQTMLVDETCKEIVKLFTSEPAATLHPTDSKIATLDCVVPPVQNSDGCGDDRIRDVVLTDDVSSSVLGAETGAAPVKRRVPVDEGTYRMKAFELLGDELCFRIAFYRTDYRLRIEMLDTDPEPMDDPLDILRWTDYVDRLAGEEDTLEGGTDTPQCGSAEGLPVLLNRCVRRGKRKRSRGCRGNTSPVVISGRRGNTSPVVIDNSLCQFDVNSYRMHWAANSHSFYYKPGSLRASRNVLRSVRAFKRAKFARFLNKWKQTNVTSEQERHCVDLMLRGHSSTSRSSSASGGGGALAKRSHKKGAGKLKC